jgi:osmotically-inducible protein OsmY
MKTNEVLQAEVQDAIKYEPLFHAAEIGVTAINGVITLSGIVDSYPKKLEAERAAKNVEGVKAVVGNIKISLVNNPHKNDNDVANEILNAFKGNCEIPGDKIKIKVEDGYVVLEGELESNYQKEAATTIVSHLQGVIGVANNLTVKSETGSNG